MKHFVLLTLTAFLAMLSACATDAPPHGGEATRIYLVRHAEKASGDNPGLNKEGQVRANALRDLLLAKGVTHIHSTAYRRTQETTQPLALALNLPILTYDPSDLPSFSEALRNSPGVHLVVGHSNTTPQLAELLSGQPTQPMSETEFDRLFEIQLTADGERMSAIETTYGNMIPLAPAD